MKLSFNKKGDIPSMIYAVVAIFIIGVLFLFSNHVTDKLYDKFDEYFNETAKYNESEAREALQDINSAENEIWDYAFLFIALGMLFVMGFSAWSTRISPIFFWIYGVLTMILLVLSVILSNTWQELAADPEFATTITRFPITNAVLGTYFPTLVIVVIAITMIFLFGKPPGGKLE